MSDLRKSSPQEQRLELDWDDAVDAFRLDLNNIDGEDDAAIFPPDLIDSMIESSLSEPTVSETPEFAGQLAEDELYNPAEPLLPGSVAPGRSSIPPSRQSIAPSMELRPEQRASLPPPRIELLSDLDDLAPPPAPPPPPSPDQPSRDRILDRGAKVALGMVRTRRAPVQHRLAASGSDGQLARVELLCALAGKATSDRAASLFTSAACVCEELGHDERAEELYRRAEKASPNAVVARRALARLAFAAKREDAAEERLRSEAEAEQVPAARGWTLHRLAIVQWLIHRDLPCALQTASEAAEAMPSELAHMLLRVRLASAAHSEDLAYILTSQEARLDVTVLRAVWLVLAGRSLERQGAREAAREAYVRALGLDPSAVDAALGIARTTPLGEAPAAYAQALLAGADALPGGKLAELLRRRAALFLGAKPSTREHALQILSELKRPLAQRTAMRLWAHSDLDKALAAAGSYAATSHGEQTATAHLWRARILRRQGQPAAANEAWAEALTADPDCELARVRCLAVAELDESRTPAHASHAPELTAAGSASRLGLEPGRSVDELEQLSSASDGSTQPVIAAVMLDAALEAGDRELAQTLLGEDARTWSGATAIGTWLALADIAQRGGDGQTAEAARALAAGVDARSCVGTRASVRAAHGSDVSAYFTREASQESASRAGLAWLRASDAASQPDERLRLLKIAYDAMPMSRSAFAGLHAQARAQGERELLQQLHTRRAASERDAEEAAAHIVRAALLRPEEEAEGAAQQLAQARALVPSDPVLRALLLGTGSAATAQMRAEALLASADAAGAPFDVALRLAAAAAFEAARNNESAQIAYATVLAQAPHHAVADSGWDRIARASGKLDELMDHHRRAVSTADNDAERVRALEGLLDLEPVSSADDVQACARALLALRPQHPLALRRLERHAMRGADTDALLDIEARMLASSTGPSARLARLRLLSLLNAMKQRERASADDFDHLVVRHAPRATPTSWLARTLASAGIATTDYRAIGLALDMLADARNESTERGALLAQRARLSLAHAAAATDIELSQQLRETAAYPTADELAGELAERLGDNALSAGSFEQAAARARIPRRAARLWARAASLYADRLGDRPRALAAYRSAATADITYDDVETRIQSLLAQEGNVDALIAHTEAYLRAANEPERRIELSRKLAQLRGGRGEHDTALSLLRAAQAEQPEHLGILQDLVSLHELRADPRAKAEALLALVRASQDPAELCEALLALAQLYQHELPDNARAEAAYKRVLSLDPDHPEALSSLFALYRRAGQPEQAEAMGERLLSHTQDPEVRIPLMLGIAHLREEREDLPGSEAMLSDALGRYGQDMRVLRNAAAFYRRRGNVDALAGHVRQAVEHMRQRILRDPADVGAWEGLVIMLLERKATDSARVVRSLADALGLPLPPIPGADGPLKGAGSAALSELLDDLVFPDTMPAAIRVMFRHGSEALNRVAPFDAKAISAQKLGRTHPFRPVAEELARRAGMAELEILSSSALPLAFVSVADAPPQLVVGEELLASLDADEQLFLTARALKIARSHASITCRVRPDEMGLLVHALIRTEIAQYAPPGHAVDTLEALTKRIDKYLSRKQSAELAPALRELASTPNLDAARVYTLASGAGNRAGLLAVGSPRAAISALLKLAGRMPDGPLSIEHVMAVEEARDLLHFTIRDAHFEARQRAGADQR